MICLLCRQDRSTEDTFTHLLMHCSARISRATLLKYLGAAARWEAVSSRINPLLVWLPPTSPED